MQREKKRERKAKVASSSSFFLGLFAFDVSAPGSATVVHGFLCSDVDSICFFGVYGNCMATAPIVSAALFVLPADVTPAKPLAASSVR